MVSFTEADRLQEREVGAAGDPALKSRFCDNHEDRAGLSMSGVWE